MNIFLNILVAFICLLIGYLFGSLNMSILIGKFVFHQDPRDFGSHNAGATNAGRIWGRKWGCLIMGLDIVKTILPMTALWAILTFVPFHEGHGLIPVARDFYIGTAKDAYIIQWPVYYMAGLGTVIGHCWPVFGQFKGGKGAASFLGAQCVTTWLFGLLLYPIYQVVKHKTKIVSFSVIVCTGSAIVLAWIYSILFLTGVIPQELYWLPTYGPTFAFVFWQPLFSTIWYAILVYRHKENIKRLIAGTERKIDDKPLQ